MALEFTRSGAKDWAKAKIKGFYMCPITPVGADRHVDEKGLRENIDAFIDMGIEGLVVGGFFAEGWNMTPSQWLRFHQVVADAGRGRIPLWTIILDPCVHTCIEKMNAVEEMGFEGAEVINPVVQLRTDDEIFDWFQYLTDHTNLAICLYRTGVGGRVLGFDLMRRLAELDTVVAVKQGAGGRVDTLRIRRELPSNFVVCDPSEAVFLDELRSGGQCVWGELSYILYGKKRHLVTEYRALAAQGKWEEARAKSMELNGVRLLLEETLLWKIMETNTYAGTVSSVKTWFDAIGLNGGYMIPPLRDLPPAQAEKLRGRLRDLGVV